MTLRGELHELVRLAGVLPRPERGGLSVGVRLSDGRERGHRRPGAEGGALRGARDGGARRESAGTANAEAGRGPGGARPAGGAGGGGETASRRRGDTDDAGHAARREVAALLSVRHRDPTPDGNERYPLTSQEANKKVRDLVDRSVRLLPTKSFLVRAIFASPHAKSVKNLAKSKTRQSGPVTQSPAK